MCDNIDDALLADEAGLEGEYDIGAEDEEALLEDNFEDHNLVSSSNRNYYASREELEEEELDHEPEEPEEPEESLDVSVDLPDEDFDDSLNKSTNQREKRNTKFVSERILPNNSFDDVQKTNNYKKTMGRPQQQQQQHFNNRTQNFNNRGIRGRGFRGRGRGNIGNRPEPKKVLINPHFQGNAHFNNQARTPWNNNTNVGGRSQPWNQQRMQPPPQQMQPTIQNFHQQIRHPNNQYMQQQQQQMDFQEPNRMPPQQRAPVHLRLGNQAAPPHVYQPPVTDITPAQPQFMDHQLPQHIYQPPPHVYQSAPMNNSVYNQPPPMQQHQPPPAQTFAPQQQLFNSPPPGYQFSQTIPASVGCYEQQMQHQNVFVPLQEQQGGFEFQPPPPPQMQLQQQIHDGQYQQQQQQLGYQQQQFVYQQPQQQQQQQQMPPPNYHPEYQPPCNEPEPQPMLQFNIQHYTPQVAPSNNNSQFLQERRVYAPPPHLTTGAQRRLGPPSNNNNQQQQQQQQQFNVSQRGSRFVRQRINSTGTMGGGNSRGVMMRGNRGGVVSPEKRRYPLLDAGMDSRRRRTELVNVRDVPTVDSTTKMVNNVVTKPVEPFLEEDEETRQYRKKIEHQKRMREKILAQKEERRRQAALNKDPTNLPPPPLADLLVLPKQSPIKTIINHTQQQQQTTTPSNMKRRVVNRNATVCNRIVMTTTTTKQATQPAAVLSEQPVAAVAEKNEISSFLTNRRIIAKDQTLPDTAVVVVSNLAAGTSEVRLRKLCQGVGNIQKLEMSPAARQATIRFKSVASAHAFFKKYQRYMIDLSMINVILKI